MREMKKAAKSFVGVHNFKSFTASGGESTSFMREIFSFKVEKNSDFFDVANKDMIKVTVKANAFLYRMVRNMVGTLIEVGLSNTGAKEVKEILKNEDREKAGPTASANGLFLEKVYY